MTRTPRRIAPSGSGRTGWSSARPLLGLTARLVLGGTFLVAGLVKVTDLDVAVLSVKSYQLLPDGVAEVVGPVLPILEIVLAGLLLVGFGTRLAAAALGVLLVLFIIGIASLWARGLSVACGCFGSSLLAADAPPSYAVEILRDVGLLLTALWLVIWPLSRLSLDARLGERAAT